MDAKVKRKIILRFLHEELDRWERVAAFTDSDPVDIAKAVHKLATKAIEVGGADRN